MVADGVRVRRPLPERGELHALEATLALITTAGHEQWPGDVRIRDRAATGLPVPSIVRWKLFTLDCSLVLRSVGALSARDRTTCRKRQPVAL